MKSFISITILFSSCFNGLAQELSASLSYAYLYSKQLDRAIQTYNFSRPFLTEKQPLFMNGLNASASYIFVNEKHIQQGINLSYSYFKSSASNKNLDNLLNLHFINWGYLLHFENAEKWKRLYGDVCIGLTTSGLFRKINGAPFVIDDEKSKSLGIGADIGFKLGYYVLQRNNHHLSPYIGLSYSPYVYAPNNEAVINATKELTSKTWTGILNLQIGLTYHRK